jgi:toxin ParE1/3/4
MYDVVITTPAKSDMRGIYTYIADELKNSTAAINRIVLINEAIQSLKQMPARFPLVRNNLLAKQGLRMVSAKSHSVYYLVDEALKTVFITRVLYAPRDWATILNN